MSEQREDRRGTGRRRLRRAVMVLLGAVIVEYLVLPQIAGARKAVHTLGTVQPGWLVAGVVFEAAAIVSYTELTRTLLPLDQRPKRSTLLRITMSTLGLSHVVPGGTAVGTSMGYRLLTTAGVTGTDAGFVIATEGLGSAVVLNMLLWLGLIVSIPIRGFNPLYGTAAVLGALLLALVGGAVIALTKGEERLAVIVCSVADRIPFLDGRDVSSGLHGVAVRLRGLATDPLLLGRAALWAALNWAFDMAALWVFLAAFGHRVGPDGLVISYGIANVLAAIPVTPGGLGVIETVLTATLVGFGTPRAVALLGVVSYRLVNFWLPIPLGAVSYLSLRVDDDVARRARELRKLAELAEEEAPRARDWARQRGVKFRRREP
jgi:uncharacterized protein (TIRG00374 family)